MSTQTEPESHRPTVDLPLSPAVTWPRPARNRTALFAGAALAAAALGAYAGAFLSSRVQTHVVASASPAPQPASATVATVATAGGEAVDPAPEPAKTEPAATLPMALVFHAMGPKLALGEVPPEALVGKARRVESDEGFELLLVRDVDRSALGEARAGVLGLEVELYDERGPRCRAEIESLAATQHFSGEWLDGDAEEMWGWNDTTTSLTAFLRPIVGDCEGAVFARQSSLDAPAIARRSVARGDLRTRAYRAFRALPRYQELQREYLAYDRQTTGAWDRSGYGEPPTVRIYDGASDRLVVVSAAVGGCGEFEGALSVAFRVGPDGALEAHPIAGGDRGADVLVAVDFDRDGTLELVAQDRWSERAIHIFAGGEWKQHVAHDATFMGCAC